MELLETHQSKNLEVNDPEVIQSLDPVEEIGNGCGGKVYKVSKKQLYACKVLDYIEYSQAAQRELLHEYEILNSFNHPNILKTYAICLSNEEISLSILQELCSINLDQAIRSKELTKAQIATMVYQIAEGMKYVHYNKVIHRNLKPSNIMITNDGTIRIADFGISKLMTVGQQLSLGNIGSQKYFAPEIINEEKYDQKVDVYSFGILVYALLNEGDLEAIKIRDVILGKRFDIPSKFTSFAKRLIQTCTSSRPSDRPSFEMIVNDLFKNDYGVVELSRSELQDVQSFINEYKAQIPSYSK